MNEPESLRIIHAIRHEMPEERRRLGTEEFVRQQRKRVEEFLRGTRARFVPSSATSPSSRSSRRATSLMQ